MVVFWFTSPSLFSRLIRRVTRSAYSHVGVMVNGCLYEVLGAGVVRRCGSDGWLRAREACAFRLLPTDKADALQAQRWLDAQLGHRYSYVGLIAAGLASVGIVKRPLVISLKGEYICSGLVASAIQLAGYIHASDPRLETPGSLADTLGAESVLWP